VVTVLTRGTKLMNLFDMGLPALVLVLAEDGTMRIASACRGEPGVTALTRAWARPFPPAKPNHTAPYTPNLNDIALSLRTRQLPGYDYIIELI
jgi:hypothetical protein